MVCVGVWKADYLRDLALGEKIPESEPLAPDRYAWLEGMPLIDILRATYEHYTEHREWLAPRLRESNQR